MRAGIIPACAGNTACRQRTVSATRDHPRVCGEHSAPDHNDFSNRGSSPRVRGTLFLFFSDDAHAGIIPACAGNTSSLISWRRCSKDHPRVCGEHASATAMTSIASGSSPRVRGTQQLPFQIVEFLGIIPACAGNTRDGKMCITTGGDHPRVCGEHHLTEQNLSALMGSSPRVRGTQPQTHLGALRRGIIPACAGNTPAWPGPHWLMRDHPRVCGEHQSCSLKALMLLGSSPRVRGTPGRAGKAGDPAGIIPACAGNTCAAACCNTFTEDHPRVCGEHTR